MPATAPFPLATILAQQKPATKAERTFQQLVGRIARTREELADWQAYELRYNQRMVEEIEPLQAQLQASHRKLAALIDDVLRGKESGHRLGRVQRDKLSRILVELVEDLLEEGDDEALEALHDKYSEVSRAEARQTEMEMAESMLNDVFGIDVGDDHGASSAEELFEHAQRELERRARDVMQEAEDARSARQHAGAGDAHRPNAAQARREQAAKEVSQSLREIYRKLASALHPDREPDPAARKRKTLMMQRVNQAYDANDLLSLLGLQLEIEQIDAAHLSSVTPKRLAHYNKVLREQLAELEAELERHVAHFRHGTGMFPGAKLTPAVVDRHLSASVAGLRLANRELREDLVALRHPAVLRDWLRRYSLDRDVHDARDIDDLMEHFESLAPEARGQARRRR